ncbi:unnamed protein product, partial [Ectocarpus sp. 12 AP-2014]
LAKRNISRSPWPGGLGGGRSGGTKKKTRSQAITSIAEANANAKMQAQYSSTATATSKSRQNTRHTHNARKKKKENGGHVALPAHAHGKETFFFAQTRPNPDYARTQTPNTR